MKKLLLHVVDNEQRDLAVRLNLALQLSLHGYQSILVKGSSLSYLIQSTENCIVLGRLSANIPSLKELNKIHAASTSVFYFHDEGAFHSDLNYNEFVSKNQALPFISHDAIKKIFFWGNHQLKIAKTLISSHESKLCLAGSARFDFVQSKTFLTPGNKKSITSILIATKGGSIFPSSNHAHPLGKRMRNILSLVIKDKNYLERTLFGRWKKSAIDAVCFVDLITELSREFPDISITVRPHPSEDPFAYNTAFSENYNVTVQPEGDIFSLMQSHSLLIGCDCTTGIEGILVGKPYINYRPLESRLLDQYAPRFLDKIGLVIERKRDVIDAIFSLNQNPENYNELINKQYSDISFLSDVVANLPNGSSQAVPFFEVIGQYLNSYCSTHPQKSTFSRTLFLMLLMRVFIVDCLRMRNVLKNPVLWRISASSLRAFKHQVAQFNESSPSCSVKFNKASVIITPHSYLPFQ
ncbi:hypothetical protein OAE53_00830 [bacterium]|nr:hypothetical protein [bacterium]